MAGLSRLAALCQAAWLRGALTLHFYSMPFSVSVHAFKPNMLHCVLCFALDQAIVVSELYWFLNSTALLLGKARTSPTPNVGAALLTPPSQHRPSAKGTACLPPTFACVCLTQSPQESCPQKLGPKSESVCAPGGFISQRLWPH